MTLQELAQKYDCEPWPDIPMEAAVVGERRRAVWTAKQEMQLRSWDRAEAGPAAEDRGTAEDWEWCSQKKHREWYGTESWWSNQIIRSFPWSSSVGSLISASRALLRVPTGSFWGRSGGSEADPGGSVGCVHHPGRTALPVYRLPLGGEPALKWFGGVPALSALLRTGA